MIDAKELKATLKKAHKLDFDAFCALLELKPESFYAKCAWHTWNRYCDFDGISPKNLQKLLDYGQKNSGV